MDFDWPYYLNTGMRNFRLMSRTVRGSIDVTSSPDKAASFAEGLNAAAATEHAVNNLELAMRLAWDARDTAFESPRQLRLFVECIVDTVNAGILKTGLRLRTGADSHKHPTYGAVASLPAEFGAFIAQFHDRLAPGFDPVETAAWVEWRVDLTDHFFADGCGKTAKILSAFVLMRARRGLPDYPGYQAYYALGPTRRRETPDVERDGEFQSFLTAFRLWQPRV